MIWDIIAKMYSIYINDISFWGGPNLYNVALIASFISSYAHVYAMMCSLFLMLYAWRSHVKGVRQLIINVHGYGYFLCNRYKIQAHAIVQKA